MTLYVIFRVDRRDKNAEYFISLNYSCTRSIVIIAANSTSLFIYLWYYETFWHYD